MPMMGPADEVDDLGDGEEVAAAMLAEVGVEVTSAVAVMGMKELADCMVSFDEREEGKFYCQSQCARERKTAKREER